MSDIPEDRLERSQPFTYCGVDHFGPCSIKDGCKESKRYGVLFSGMSLRAIELEIIFGQRLFHKCVEALPKS